MSKLPRNTAFHEAGHVVVDHVLLGYRGPSVTIVPTGDMLGVTDGPTISDMIDDGSPGMRKRMADFAVSLVAGKVAEEIMTGKPAEVGEGNDYAVLDRVIFGYAPRVTVVGSERRARRFLRQHWHLVECIAEALVEHKTLTEDQVDELLLSNSV